MKWFSIYFSVNDVCKLDLNNTLGLETLGLSLTTHDQQQTWTFKESGWDPFQLPCGLSKSSKSRNFLSL